MTEGLEAGDPAFVADALGVVARARSQEDALMSDDPFAIPPIPIMSPEKARDVGRAYQGLATRLADIGVPTEAARLERTAQWWLTYSIGLAQTKKPDGE